MSKTSKTKKTGVARRLPAASGAPTDTQTAAVGKCVRALEAHARHPHDTPAYRDAVVAGLYSQAEAEEVEFDDFIADTLRRYQDFELTLPQVEKRLGFLSKAR